MTALKVFGQETGVPYEYLSSLDFYQFWVSCGAKNKKYIPLVDVFCKRNALQMNTGEVQSQIHWIAKASGHYKPIVPNHDPPDAWINDYPRDMRDEILERHSPKPKFTS